MQFKVPQDVQQADRIVWFLTLPQLIICIVGFAIAYGIYAVLERQGLPIVIWLPPVAIVVLITCAFAFLKIANLSFHRYLALMIERFITPSKRVWVKGADRIITDSNLVEQEDKKKAEKKKKKADLQASKEKKLQSIDELAQQLDTKKNPAPEEADETKTVDKTKDEELLQTAFGLEGKKREEAPAKRPQTAEEKILEISREPGETAAEKQAATAEKTPATAEEEAPQKKKRRRKRRRGKKKKKGAEGGERSEANDPSISKASEDAKNEQKSEKKEVKEVKEVNEAKEMKEAKEPNEKKEVKEPKEAKEANETSEPTPPNNPPNPTSPSKPPQPSPSPQPDDENAKMRKLEPQNDPPVPAWLEEKEEQPTTEKQPMEPNETKEAKETSDPTPPNNPPSPSNHPNPTTPSTPSPSGEFTPEDLKGEGQTISFDK